MGSDVEKVADNAKAWTSGKAEGTPGEVARATALNTAKVARKIPKASWSDFTRHFVIPKNAPLLFGTAGSWFMLDVAYCGLSLNNALILQVISYFDKGAHNTYERLCNTAIGNLIIVLAGAVPGCWFTVATVDTLDRRTIQTVGFFILTLLFILVGFGYNHIKNNSPDGLLAIEGLAQFFFKVGSNATTFILLGELILMCYVLGHLSGGEVSIGTLCPMSLDGPDKFIQVRFSPRTTDRPTTVFGQPQARSVPLLARGPSQRYDPAGRPRAAEKPLGWTTY